ncbi:MAG: HIT domain-containing protein [Patescibacteria group bacterium]
MPCLFCQISQNKIPSNAQLDTKDLFAFDDIHPKAPVHILIIPKKHIPSTAEVSEADIEILGKMILSAKKLAEKLNINQTGYRLIFNTKNHGGQIVDHIHLHLIGGKQLGPMA